MIHSLAILAKKDLLHVRKMAKDDLSEVFLLVNLKIQ